MCDFPQLKGNAYAWKVEAVRQRMKRAELAQAQTVSRYTRSANPNEAVHLISLSIAIIRSSGGDIEMPISSDVESSPAQRKLRRSAHAQLSINTF
jgi:hypothetical protein